MRKYSRRCIKLTEVLRALLLFGCGIERWICIHRADAKRGTRILNSAHIHYEATHYCSLYLFVSSLFLRLIQSLERVRKILCYTKVCTECINTIGTRMFSCLYFLSWLYLFFSFFSFYSWVRGRDFLDKILLDVILK